MNKLVTLVAAGATVLMTSTAMAQVSTSTTTLSSPPMPDTGKQQSATQNNAESRQYQNMVQADRGYRQSRVQRECGSIESADLKQQCVDSFAAYNDSGAGNRQAATTSERRSTTSRSSASGTTSSRMTSSGMTSSGSSGSDAMRSGSPNRSGMGAATVNPSAKSSTQERTGDGGSGGAGAR